MTIEQRNTSAIFEQREGLPYPQRYKTLIDNFMRMFPDIAAKFTRPQDDGTPTLVFQRGSSGAVAIYVTPSGIYYINSGTTSEASQISADSLINFVISNEENIPNHNLSSVFISGTTSSTHKGYITPLDSFVSISSNNSIGSVEISRLPVFDSDPNTAREYREYLVKAIDSTILQN